MRVISTQQSLDDVSKFPSIFLAGPTPRSDAIYSWRNAAVVEFARQGWEHNLLLPEPFQGDYRQQIEWEERALNLATVIMFWIPRKLDSMPGFTTNIEFGRWMNSGKIVLGSPPEATKMKYLNYYAGKLDIPNSSDMKQTIATAIKKVSEIEKRAV